MQLDTHRATLAYLPYMRTTLSWYTSTGSSFIKCNVSGASFCPHPATSTRFKYQIEPQIKSMENSVFHTLVYQELVRLENDTNTSLAEVEVHFCSVPRWIISNDPTYSPGDWRLLSDTRKFCRLCLHRSLMYNYRWLIHPSFCDLFCSLFYSSISSQTFILH